MEKAQRKVLGLPEDDDFSVDNVKDVEFEEPTLGSKAKSAMPFSHLHAGAAAAGDADEEMTEENKS